MKQSEEVREKNSSAVGTGGRNCRDVSGQNRSQNESVRSLLGEWDYRLVGRTESFLVQYRRIVLKEDRNYRGQSLKGRWLGGRTKTDIQE